MIVDLFGASTEDGVRYDAVVPAISPFIVDHLTKIRYFHTRLLDRKKPASALLFADVYKINRASRDRQRPWAAGQLVKFDFKDKGKSLPMVIPKGEEIPELVRAHRTVGFLPLFCDDMVAAVPYWVPCVWREAGTVGWVTYLDDRRRVAEQQSLGVIKVCLCGDGGADLVILGAVVGREPG